MAVDVDDIQRMLVEGLEGGGLPIDYSVSTFDGEIRLENGVQTFRVDIVEE